MAKIRVNKVDAARRQIEAAIRLLFANEDPVAIHALVAAGFRILKDLAEQSGKVLTHQYLKAIIKPGKEKDFWKLMNRAANFLKHADRDPDEILNVKEEISDAMLLFACSYYRDLVYDITPEMTAFVTWYIALYPDSFTHLKPFLEILDQILDLKEFRTQPRHKQLETGKLLLTTAPARSRNGIKHY